MTLETTLTSLEHAHILRRLGTATEDDLGALYRFKHSLTQDSAYRSLPRRQRQQIHRRVAKCYEELFAGQLDKQAAVLAHHYGEAQDDEKFLEFSRRAGDAALRVYATAEANAHFERALEAANRGPQISSQQLVYLYERRGRALELSSQHGEALVNYEDMEHRGRSLGFRDLELAAIIAQAVLRCTATILFDAEAGRQLVDRGLSLAAELSDRAAESKILWTRANLNRLSSHQTKALEDSEASLAIARDLGLREQVAYTLNDMGYIVQMRGDQARTLKINAEATAYWREVGNQPMLADSLAATLWSHYALGNFAQAVAASSEAHEISVRIGNVWGQSFSRMLVGLVHLETGDLDQAMSAMDESLAKAEEAGFPVPRVMVPPQKAMVYTLLGDYASAREILRPLLTGPSTVMPESAGLAYVAWLEILLAEGNNDEAERIMGSADLADMEQDTLGFFILGVGALIRYYLAKGDARLALETATAHIATVQKRGLRTSLPDSGLQQAYALLALDREDEARHSLEMAIEVAAELGARRVQWQILAAMAEIATDRHEAMRLWQEAGEVVAYLADRAPTEALQASFLALPAVRHILETVESIEGFAR